MYELAVRKRLCLVSIVSVMFSDQQVNYRPRKQLLSTLSTNASTTAVSVCCEEPLTSLLVHLYLFVFRDNLISSKGVVYTMGRYRDLLATQRNLFIVVVAKIIRTLAIGDANLF